MDALESVMKARDLLEHVTPLRRDCGRVCGGACCQPDEDGRGGMLLFPGEDVLYRDLPAGFAVEKDDSAVPGASLLTCSGFCTREKRPLSCRLFPLLPARNGSVLDQRAWAVCPLMESGKRGLDPAFVQAVEQAGRILYGCPETAAFLEALHLFNRRLTEW